VSDRIDAVDVYTEEVASLYDEAGASCNPVSRDDTLLGLAVQYGVGPESLVLDVGCANGGMSRKLLACTGCRIEGVEMHTFLVNIGIEENRERGVDDRFTIREGSMTDIPFGDETFDFVFCCDVVGMVEDIERGYDECRRVLKSGGRMLVYATSFATERLSQAEARELNDALGNAREGTDRARIERPLRERFTVLEEKLIGSEGHQYQVEANHSSAEASENLLKFARMLTWPERYIEKYGERTYRIVLAELQWAPFIMLGKLAPAVFIVEKTDNS
jgi:ubiquinone/menaquinone biosynthesis C-methylase UbiE